MLSRAMRVGAYQRKAELLAERGEFELGVIVPRRWPEHGSETPPERAFTRGYDLVERDVRLPGRFHLYSFKGLAADLDRLAPALLHVDEEPYNLAAFQAVRAARRRGIPCVFFAWQNIARRYPPPFAAFERYVLAGASAAIAGSRGAADILRAKGFARPLWVIPQLGVDEERFTPTEQARAGGEGRMTVGFAGRLVAEKGVEVAIEALRWCPSGVRLEILGDGPALEALRRRAEGAGLADRVAFLTPLSSTEMPRFFRRIDVLVLPSLTTRRWKEQFGRVLIEAMACGAVAVGSDSGEIPWVIGDAGLVVPEGDAGALAVALTRLAEYPGLRGSLADAGRRRVLERYTMAAIADRTLEAWRTVVETSGADSASARARSGRSARQSTGRVPGP